MSYASGVGTRNQAEDCEGECYESEDRERKVYWATWGASKSTDRSMELRCGRVQKELLPDANHSLWQG
jgi:hypothetical protein